MKYDYKKIGQRIKSEREKAVISRFLLAEQLGYSDDLQFIVYGWEHGTSFPGVDDLLKMCEIFECDLGYLLCEYDHKVRDNESIYESTGLSEEAIAVLNKLNSSDSKSLINILEQLITHEDFIDLLKRIQSYVWNFNEDNFSAYCTSCQELSELVDCDVEDIRDYIELASGSRIKSILLYIVNNMKL